MSTQFRTSAAHTEGEIAYLEEKTIWDNPYANARTPKEENARDEWEQGWLSEKDEDEQDTATGGVS